ncbi:MAG: hypothetical protein ABIZ04_04150 [Opitutus sp.]
MNSRVKNHPLRAWLVCALWPLIGVNASGGPLELRDPSGVWMATDVQRPVTGGVTVEFVVTRPNERERVVVFRSNRADDSAETLVAFAHRVKDSFAASLIGEVTERAAEEMGFSGHELRFELADAHGESSNLLFVFEHGGEHWGALYVNPGGKTSGESGGFGLLRKSVASPVVVMEPFRVKSTAITGFPVGLAVGRNKQTNHVTSVVITEIKDPAWGQHPEMRPGDLVVRIDGRKVEDFIFGMGLDSELGRIFLNRRVGDWVDLDLLESDTRRPYSVRLFSAEARPFG